MDPATQKIVRAWLMLTGLSLALAIAADVRTPSRLPIWFMAAIGLIIIAKARLILDAYLELDPAGGMMKALIAMITLTLVLVIGSFVPG